MATHAEGLGGRLLDRARQALCGLHGHDTLLQFGHDRMFLRCVSCGHETPGWELKDESETIVHAKTAPGPRPIMQPQLISERRVA